MKYRLKHARFKHPVNTVVYPFSGHTYGLVYEDTEATGLEHTAVTLNADGSGPFFTVPVNELDPVND